MPASSQRAVSMSTRVKIDRHAVARPRTGGADGTKAEADRIRRTCRTGCRSPRNWPRREARLAAIATAKATIEARAKERHARGKRADYDRALLKAREAGKTAATKGKKPAGRPPAAPVEGPLRTDQVNLTDEESCGSCQWRCGGFEQCYNAQDGSGGRQSAGDRGRCGAGAERQAAA